MKIKYIKLENFLGIYAGMNRTSVEIDFKNNKNKIIILNAANGKGKTTLLSMLHPLRETFDDRKDIVIPNELGHKIVDLTHEGNEYHIEHFYGKKNKSFISKNGKELNENGNIKSFNEIAKEELGIDGDYFKIGRIGSNVSNFIDLKATERKKYITEFIPSIDEYLVAFDTIKEKFTSYNSQIKLIKGTIEKYAGLKELDEIKAYVKQLTKQNDEFQTKLGKVKAKIESFSEDKKKLEDEIVNYINNETDYHIDNFEMLNSMTMLIDDDLDETEKTLGVWQEEYNNFLENNKILVTENIPEYMKNLQNKFNIRKAKLENELETLKESLKECTSDLLANQNVVEVYNQKLKDIDGDLSEEQIEEFRKELTETNKYLEIAKKQLEDNKKKLTSEEYEETVNFYNTKSIDPVNILTYANTFIDMIDTLKSQYDLSTLEGYYSYIENSENILDKKGINAEISKLEHDIQENNAILNKIEGRLKLVSETLPKRSTKCTDDTCSFIKNALDIQKSDIPEQDKRLKKQKELQEKLDELTELRDTISVYIEIEKFLNDTYNYIKKHFPDYIYTKLFNRKLLITNNTDLIKEFKIDILYNIFTKKDVVEKCEIQKESFMNKISVFDMSKSLIDEYKENLDKANDAVTTLKEKIETCNEKIVETDLKIKSLIIRISRCDEFFEINKNLTECTDIYHKLIKTQTELSKLLIEYKNFKTKNNIDDLKDTEDMLERSIKELKTKLDENNTAVRIIEDNMKKLSEIEKVYKDVVLIKDALDPKKGIPVVFANEYLKNIATKANNLLKIAYGDHFKIRFNITSTDFLVEVYKSDGTFLNDIKLASQGETSLTNVSLSLAMLECMIKKYNIVYLDEVDCTLSTENRKLFIEMLENQMDSLNIEQCFVISHNNEFYDKNIDLILLEGHDCDLNDKDFMAGKNVIFKL